MEKRYQVFISSTFQDLQNARLELSQVLLRADCHFRLGGLARPHASSWALVQGRHKFAAGACKHTSAIAN